MAWGIMFCIFAIMAAMLMYGGADYHQLENERRRDSRFWWRVW